MQQVQASSKNIHIWSIPKSGSTVLSKAFACRSDTKSVVEYFLTERNKSGERIRDVATRRRDFDFVKSYLDRQSQLYEVTVSKEHGFVYAPWIERGDLEKYIMTDPRHIILFREPTAAMKSYQHVLMSAEQGDIVPELREEEVSFKALKALYMHTFPENILLDFADMVCQPQVFLSGLCKRLGISDESEKMSCWGQRTTEIDHVLRDPNNSIWFETLRQSGGIDQSYVNDRSTVFLPDDMQEIVENNKVIYDFFVERKDVLVKQ